MEKLLQIFKKKLFYNSFLIVHMGSNNENEISNITMEARPIKHSFYLH
jgi:hypothetical protein